MKRNSENHDDINLSQEEDILAEKLEAWSERYSIFDLDEVENGNTMEFDLSDAAEPELSVNDVVEEQEETEELLFNNNESFKEELKESGNIDEAPLPEPEDLEKTRSFSIKPTETVEKIGKTKQFMPITVEEVVEEKEKEEVEEG